MRAFRTARVIGTVYLHVDSLPTQFDVFTLVSIDAGTTVAGHQAFTFISAAAFTHHAGELRAVSADGVTSITGDVNGDAVADFQIRATGTIAFVAADFVL